MRLVLKNWNEYRKILDGLCSKEPENCELERAGMFQLLNESSEALKIYESLYVNQHSKIACDRMLYVVRDLYSANEQESFYKPHCAVDKDESSCMSLAMLFNSKGDIPKRDKYFNLSAEIMKSKCLQNNADYCAREGMIYCAMGDMVSGGIQFGKACLKDPRLCKYAGQCNKALEEFEHKYLPQRM